MTDDIHSRLGAIQVELKAPKGQYNSFGKYSFRNCEDILEAVKPLLGDLILTLSDDIVMAGERFYVKATARLMLGEQMIVVHAFARESLDKKGMDQSQITGAASSYARKYALNGLFLIDDTKDADTQDNTQTQAKPASTLLEVMMDGNDIDITKYWRGLNQPEQEVQWASIDSQTQKKLKQILNRTKADK